MEAARKLLQPADYEAVVEERAVDGLCGFPPCGQPATGTVPGKRWAINVAHREVLATEELGRFCSQECRKLSTAWSMKLEPDPTYCRPASAVAASRAAVAEATDCRTAAAAKATAPSGARPSPKVRPRAVVRFSRESHTYTVHYSDYDGGGALPDVAYNPSGDIGNGPASASTAGTGSIREILRAPVQERSALEASRGERAQQDTGEASLEGAASEEEVSDGEAGDDLFEADAVFPGGKWTGSPFVRAWGVLSSWLTDLVMEVLRSGVQLPTVDEESRPAQRGRRELLLELLMLRVPGDAAFLAPRFHDVVRVLSVHQTLPLVTEMELWDLLGALLLRAVLQCDVCRGALETNPYCERVLNHRVETAAKGLGLAASELESLSGLLLPAELSEPS